MVSILYFTQPLSQKANAKHSRRFASVGKMMEWHSSMSARSLSRHRQEATYLTLSIVIDCISLFMFIVSVSVIK